MKRYFGTFVLPVLLCVPLASCSEAPPTASHTNTSEASHYTAQQPAPVVPRPPTTKTIQILSQPPGARIEVNDDYIGDAPCSVQVRCDADGRFFETTRIRAMPVANGYTQIKFFNGYGEMKNPYLHSDPIPSRIFFDTNLGPVSQDIHVDVNEGD